MFVYNEQLTAISNFHGMLLSYLLGFYSRYELKYNRVPSFPNASVATCDVIDMHSVGGIRTCNSSFLQANCT